MTEALVPVPTAAEERELETKALSLKEQAATLVIHNRDEYEEAVKLFGVATDGERAVHAYFDELVEQAHTHHKALVKKRADALEPWTWSKGRFRDGMRVFDDEQERIRRERERVLQEQARREQEAEALAEAEARKAEGATETEALAAIDEVLATPPPVVRVEAPKTKGIATRYTYSAEVADFAALVAYIAGVPVAALAHPEDLALLAPAGPNLNARARSQREGFKLPGVRLLRTAQYADTRR